MCVCVCVCVIVSECVCVCVCERVCVCTGASKRTWRVTAARLPSIRPTCVQKARAQEIERPPHLWQTQTRPQTR